jgi:tetratricopeptide (TPR) repeat protein
MPTASSDDKLPWLILVGFVSVVLFSTAAFSSFISSLSSPFRSYVPDNPTAQGVITSRDLQATAIAEEATAVARMTLVALPTATPRSVEENIRAARNLYNLGIYDHAIDLYNRAILAVSDDGNLYFERGQAQAALFRQGDLQAAAAAIADFTTALSFSSDPAPVQRERGLVYRDLWRLLGTSDTMQAAQADLQAYAIDHPDDELIAAALAELAEPAGNRQEK